VCVCVYQFVWIGSSSCGCALCGCVVCGCVVCMCVGGWEVAGSFECDVVVGDGYGCRWCVWCVAGVGVGMVAGVGMGVVAGVG